MQFAETKNLRCFPKRTAAPLPLSYPPTPVLCGCGKRPQRDSSEFLHSGCHPASAKCLTTPDLRCASSTSPAAERRGHLLRRPCRRSHRGRPIQRGSTSICSLVSIACDKPTK